MFVYAGAQIPLSAMGQSVRQRRGWETQNLQVSETTSVEWQ